MLCMMRLPNLHLDDLLVEEAAAVVYHVHCPLCVAGGFRAALGLLYPTTVIVPVFLKTTLLTPEECHPAAGVIMSSKSRRDQLCIACLLEAATACTLDPG